ncbi:fumarylacetoacetate hydrolase family protein [Pseudoxanthomonas sp. JBR18]|uniref:fumarylacetoacetate hydrolase family protein n=1 Tax=Pseudoxanthomonas sp. JBR18 TaxID=2969308 RepID=UPI002305EDEE|nr:fumarylacetoacetate hydrolase family protein [Pseudoxanthomonas sp. JBR18]WCE06231.1 fumarylacetoacetate hydrolase family protein [Pseudoxanthomonas sp. JBR18]
MRFIAYRNAQGVGLAARHEDGSYRGLLKHAPSYPGDLNLLIATGDARVLAEAGRVLLKEGEKVQPDAVSYLPPVSRPPKIICIGLNYADHTNESGFKPQEYPTVFARFASSLIGHGAPIIRPAASDQLDYEGELAAIIGKRGRNISKADALDHVVGYALFNDASIRDYQFKSPQWTVGKNFDDTGAFGPEFVTADELPPGARGLMLRTKLNGQVMQEASTDDMVFDIPTLIETLSEAFTLEPGDVIVTGTPAGVGLARTPPVWMKHGDVCEVEVDGFQTLINPIRNANDVATEDAGSQRAA